MVRAGKVSAWVGAVALFVSGVWYGLLAEHITVGAPPVSDPSVSVSERYARFFEWLRATLLQERIADTIAIVGFVALIVVAVALRDRLGKEEPWAEVGALVVAIGALSWIFGTLLQEGGHDAAAIWSTSNEPIEGLGPIYETVEKIDDWFELAAFAFLGAGIIALAWAGRAARHRGWCWYSLGVGIVCLVLTGAYMADAGDLIDGLLVVGGVLLLPIWLVWAGRLVEPSQT